MNDELASFFGAPPAQSQARMDGHAGGTAGGRGRSTTDAARSHRSFAVSAGSPPAARAAGDGDTLTHVDSDGTASMVDVGDKAHTARLATASARVLLGPAAFAAVRDNTLKKGDVLSTAKLAGICGAKVRRITRRLASLGRHPRHTSRSFPSPSRS